jgi:hypothetical protein
MQFFRPRSGPPIPGAPWTRSVLPAPSGGTPQTEPTRPTFLFDENPDTPQRLRRVCQQLAQTMNSLIRAGKLTVNFLGTTAEVALDADQIEEALGGTPVLDDFQIVAGTGLSGGGTLGDQQGAVTLYHGEGKLEPGTYTLNTFTAGIKIDQFGHVIGLDFTNYDPQA